jgi:hypothetical protein
MSAPAYHEQAIVKVGLSEVTKEINDSWQAGQTGLGQNTSIPNPSQMKKVCIQGEAHKKPKK